MKGESPTLMTRDADSINLHIFKEQVLEAISTIRKGHKRPEKDTIYDHINIKPQTKIMPFLDHIHEKDKIYRIKWHSKRNRRIYNLIIVTTRKKQKKQRIIV